MTTGQFDRFREFSKLQEQDLKSRATWLAAELTRVGIFTTDYDPETNYPVRFSVVPDFSYAAKLLLAYKIMGGFPEHEMLLRTRDKPVFKVRGAPITMDEDNPDAGYSDEYSNGRRERGGMRFDRDLGLRVNRIKAWQLEAIKRKRESLEFKIKKAMDYSDQLSEEFNVLQKMIGNDESSLQSLFADARSLMFATGSHTVLDNPDDLFGTSIGRRADMTVPGELDSAAARGSLV